jgi:hypothetical protein
MFKCSGWSCCSVCVCVFHWAILVAGHIHCFHHAEWQLLLDIMYCCNIKKNSCYLHSELVCFIQYSTKQWFYPQTAISSWSCGRYYIFAKVGIELLHGILDEPHIQRVINPLNTELNPILALLGAHHILHVSRIRVKP